jgi:hypothetical protein
MNDTNLKLKIPIIFNKLAVINYVLNIIKIHLYTIRYHLDTPYYKCHQ